MHSLIPSTNLHTYNLSHFQGLPILIERGPFILEYLEKLYLTIKRALNQYPRLFAVRFDLRYLDSFFDSLDAHGSAVIERFVESLRAKIKHDRKRAAQRSARIHSTSIRYACGKEYGTEGKPHYHCLLLLNLDAYHTLGNFTSDQENLYCRIQSAWASALGINWNQSLGLVHIPDNPIYCVRRDNQYFILDELFRRASYLCKIETKKLANQEHSFGCSRI